MTLSDFLNTFSNGGLLEADPAQLNREIERVTFAIDTDSRLRTSCSGQAVIRIEWAINARGLQNRPSYIVVDDHDGEQWGRQKQAGEPLSQSWRPFPVLRLVQSA